MAVVAIHNNGAAGESLSIYAPDGQRLGRLTEIPQVKGIGGAFLGVVSTVPIGRIVFDEDPGSDDTGLSSVMFASRRREAASDSGAKPGRSPAPGRGKAGVP